MKSIEIFLETKGVKNEVQCLLIKSTGQKLVFEYLFTNPFNSLLILLCF